MSDFSSGGMTIPEPPSGSTVKVIRFSGNVVGSGEPNSVSEAKSPIRVGPPMSVSSALGMFQLMSGRRTKPSSDSTWAFIPLISDCWRAWRAKSSSLGLQSLWRTRERASARLPSRWVVPLGILSVMPRSCTRR